MAEETFGKGAELAERFADAGERREAEEEIKKKEEERKNIGKYVRLTGGGKYEVEEKLKEKVSMKAIRKKIKEEEIEEKKPVSQLKGIFTGLLGIKKKYKKGEVRPMKDELKVLRLQNMLDRKRLQNQIERFKLSRRVDLLRKKGILKQVIAMPIKPIAPLYPAYATPEIAGDIDSSFNADIQHGESSLFGGEQYYNESFYNEDYFSDEWNLSPWEHLNIAPKRGVSPLLW